MTWKSHAKKCVERHGEFSNKTTKQFYKVATPCMDDHQFEEEIESIGELSTVCSQIVLKSLYLARTGRPDILWFENKLVRARTKWTKACDKRLVRLISYIHHTREYKQYCVVGNTAKQCRLGLFRDWFCRRLGRLEINIRRKSLHFRKSHVRANELDVQETDFCFT